MEPFDASHQQGKSQLRCLPPFWLYRVLAAKGSTASLQSAEHRHSQHIKHPLPHTQLPGTQAHLRH